MARVEFNLPDVGEGLADVEVLEWFVKVGDFIEENQPIADVETDKAVVTMPAPATGNVVELAAQAGERVNVGSLFVVIETEKQPATVSTSEATTAPLADTPSTEAPTNGKPQAATSSNRVMASPVARKMARELGIALEDIVGSGSKGRITTDDVQRHADQLKQAAPATPAPPLPSEATPSPAVERVPVRGLRRRIAEYLTETYRNIPQVSGFHEFDALALVNERNYLLPRAEATGVYLTFLPFIIKAVVEALKKHPYLNSSYVEGDDPVILLKKAYNIGIATATPEGLVVPILHQADQLDLFEIARRSEQLINNARERRSTPQDMKDGTFTVSNVGPAGGWFGTSLLHGTEAAILGVGKIEEKAVVRDGQIVARPIIPISLTFDHRVIDGDEALAFIQTLRHYLEDDPRSLSSY